MIGPWAPENDQYAASLWTFVPFATGAMALWGTLSRADWIDLQAVTHPHRRDTIAATVVIAAFAGTQALVGWLYNLDDRFTWFVPEALVVFPVEIYLLGALRPQRSWVPCVEWSGCSDERSARSGASPATSGS